MKAVAELNKRLKIGKRRFQLKSEADEYRSGIKLKFFYKLRLKFTVSIAIKPALTKENASLIITARSTAEII